MGPDGAPGYGGGAPRDGGGPDEDAEEPPGACWYRWVGFDVMKGSIKCRLRHKRGFNSKQAGQHVCEGQKKGYTERNCHGFDK